MVHYWFLFTLIFTSFSHGQDERYYRQILSGKLPSLTKEFVEQPVHQFNVQGASYLIDFDEDGVEEALIPQKRDGVDWLEIRDISKRKIFEARLLSMGSESFIYKVRLIRLSLDAKVLVIFLDEGFTSGRRFESTARIFLISYEKNDLKTMKMTQGPHFFHERKAFRDMYFRRDYTLSVIDHNQDGKKEISIQYNHIQRIMEYLGNGVWQRY